MHARMTLLVAAFTVLASPVLAQAPAPSAETKEAMAKLSFLVGRWSGDATFQMGPQASELTQTETVESRLDGLVLVVEGVGTGKADGKVHHHAVATISWDATAKNYRVVAIRADGNSVVTTGSILEDGAFQWGFAMGNMTVRYTIRHAEGDEWHETGEVSMDGTTWRKMIDMRLKRV